MIGVMFRTCSAVWLVILTLSPLTAPFSLCEWRLWFAQSGERHASDRSEAPGAVQADASTMPLVSRAETARRLRLFGSIPCARLISGLATFPDAPPRVLANTDAARAVASLVILRI